MLDNAFDDPRLAALLDPLDPDPSDLDVYVAIFEELGAGSVLDVGCGTGTFAAMLADPGVDVVGVEPAGASLEIAHGKSDRVRWVHGDASALAGVSVDLVTMTANVAQVFVSDEEWLATLNRLRDVLGPGGHLVLETRDPARAAWRGWNRDETLTRAEVPGIGAVETWCDVTDVAGDLVSFRWTYVFEEGATTTSDSTLRFRSRDGVEESLATAGFEVVEIRDAPDRPGREMVFLARVTTA